MSTESRLSERDLHHVTADDLERLLVESETAIARLRHLQTLVIREADVRQLPLGDGCRTLSEWVSGRADVERSTADALVRVARRQDAELDQALAGGRAGFDRVSVAAGTDEADLAPHLDIAGLRRRAVRTHRLSRLDEIRRYGRRSFSYQRDLFGSSGRFWGEGPALETDAIFSAIETAADGLPSSPAGHPEPRSARRFDGLLALALGDAGDQQVNTTVIVEATEAAPTDGEAGVWLASGPRIGPGTLERILCDSTCEIIARAQDGTPLTVGDAQTAIPPRTRRWVLARDGGMCTADGCRSVTRLQPHHMEPRARNGDHHHANLTTLCWFHHHVVIHGRGFRIDPDSHPQRRRFLPPEHRSNDPP
ncbi:MAG: HNH endonuclease [Acidimicrobiia bacterium]|nr:HNH endonuclease [Acidimicrobiia bacterium]